MYSECTTSNFEYNTEENEQMFEYYCPNTLELTNSTLDSDTIRYPIDDFASDTLTSSENENGSNDKVYCNVCGDKAIGCCLGVLSCQGCKGFIRRSLQRHTEYECLSQGNCRVTQKTRNLCQYCRFKKCKEVGMEKYPNWPNISPKSVEIDSIFSNSDDSVVSKMRGEPVAKERYLAQQTAVVMQILKSHIQDDMPINIVELSKQYNVRSSYFHQVIDVLEEFGVVERLSKSSIKFKHALDFDEMERVEEEHQTLFKLEDEENKLDKDLQEAENFLKTVKNDVYAFVTKYDLNMKDKDVLLAKTHGTIQVTPSDGKVKIICDGGAVKVDGVEVNKNGIPETAQTRIKLKPDHSVAGIASRSLGFLAKAKSTSNRNTNEFDREITIFKSMSGSNDKYPSSDKRTVAQYLEDEGVSHQTLQKMTKNNQYLIPQNRGPIEVEIERRQREAAERRKLAEKQESQLEQLSRKRKRRAVKNESANNGRSLSAKKRKAITQYTLPMEQTNMGNLVASINPLNLNEYTTKYCALKEVRLPSMADFNFDPNFNMNPYEQDVYFQQEENMFNGIISDQTNMAIEEPSCAGVISSSENVQQDYYVLPSSSNYHVMPNQTFEVDSYQEQQKQNFMDGLEKREFNEEHNAYDEDNDEVDPNELIDLGFLEEGLKI